MKTLCTIPMIALAVLCLFGQIHATDDDPSLPYTIVDTGQIRCYDDRAEISYPRPASMRRPLVVKTDLAVKSPGPGDLLPWPRSVQGIVR